MNIFKLAYEIVELPVVSVKRGVGRVKGSPKRKMREFTYGDNANQRVLLYEPKTVLHDTVVIYFHGGGYVAGSPDSMGAIADIFCNKGYRFLSVGYRLLQQAAFPAQVEDAYLGYAVSMRVLEKLAEEHDQEYITPPVVVGGNSVGAQLAALLAYSKELSAGYGIDTSEIKGVISIAGFMDVRDSFERIPKRLGRNKLLSTTTERALKKYSPVDVIDETSTAEFLAIHGKQDQISPYKSMQRFVKRLNELAPLESEASSEEGDRWSTYYRGATPERQRATLLTLKKWRYQHVRISGGIYAENQKNSRGLRFLFRWLEHFDPPVEEPKEEPFQYDMEALAKDAAREKLAAELEGNNQFTMARALRNDETMFHDREKMAEDPDERESADIDEEFKDLDMGASDAEDMDATIIR